MIGEPQDVDAEKAVLGGIFLSPDSMADIEAVLQPGDFYRPAHRLVFQAMRDLARAKEPIDTLTVVERLKAGGHFDVAGGYGLIASLDANVPASANAARYARRVKDVAVRRQLIASCVETMRDAQDDGLDLGDVLNAAESRLSLVRDAKAETRELVTVGTAVKRVFDRVVSIAESARDITGITSGFPAIDRVTTGWQSGEFIVIAGRAKMGKTSLAMNFAEHAATQCSVAVFSLEMSEDSLAQRMMAGAAGVNSHALRTGRLNDDEWRRLTRASERLHRMPIYVDDQAGITVLDIRARLRRLRKRDPNVKLCLVDYIQILRGESRGGRREFSREQEVAGISRALKELAKELAMPVIALAQLKRDLDLRASKEPVLADLRESGAIEQDADLVSFIYRPGAYDENAPPEEAKFIIAAYRNGPTASIPLRWRREFSRFESTGDDAPAERWG